MSDQNESGPKEGLGRRDLLSGIATGAAAAAATMGAPKALADVAAGPSDSFDYIVVGSGAGGGPVACNLAKAGFRVLLLEAGNNAKTKTYDVPVFHGLSTEDPAMAWNFFVKHYGDPTRAARDSKMTAGRGILYPRAGTLGGCTAHNAMITLYPDNSDFANIMRATGDRSWDPAAMRKFYQRVENQSFQSDRAATSASRREGTNGWLTTEQTSPAILLKSKKLLALVFAAAEVEGIGRELVEKLIDQHANLKLDPNEWAYVQNKKDGLFNIPKATEKGKRNGTRELILRTLAKYPNNLTLRTDCLATQVLFQPGTTRAIGIEYLQGKGLYRATPNASVAPGTKRAATARREVILAGGAFNTPQLLMLSGIGAKAELAKFGIQARVDLPGVGRNLQDRYEVGITAELNDPISLLKDCTFMQGNDPCLNEWNGTGREKSLYASNGVVIAMIKRSSKNKPDPDLCIFGVPGKFVGYKPGWARSAVQKNAFTWLVLKGHTQNTNGYVTLRSKDPRDTPEINFRYFDESNDAARDDLESVLKGVKIVRTIYSKLPSKLVTKRELVPGPNFKTDDQLRTFIKNEAWGHHASCSNKMGPRQDPTAVVDSKFRVHGTQGLRVVDASVFPRVPGLFIVVPIYMAAEKASDEIIADARTGAAAPAAVRP